MSEQWKRYRKTGYWYHSSISFLWTNWAIGILFDSGRRFLHNKNENGFMILLSCIIFRVFWRKKL